MTLWSIEIQELQYLLDSLSDRFPDLEKELQKLINTEDENMVLVYSRRSLEVLVTDLCEGELGRPRKTEPLKGVIDKLNKEEKVPAHIITSMLNLNSLSAYGAHPKEFDPKQVKPVLNNLSTIIEWYLKYKDIKVDNPEKEKEDESSYIPRDNYPVNTVSHPGDNKSILVLPFDNLSPDPEQEYFSDGLTEEIITDLSYIKDLLVISRSSAMTFKGTKKKIRDIAGDVNVRYVLEGSVRKAGNNLRITAQLIDAVTDTHLWANKYSGTLDDVFEIQEKVSRSIVDSLKINLSPREGKEISEHIIDNITAYECYMQAKQEIYRFTEKGMERGLQLLLNGLQITGENELLHATMGTAYYFSIDAGIGPRDLFLPKIEASVEKIFSQNPGSAHGHYLMGCIHILNRNMQEAVRDFKKSLDIQPNNPDCVLQLIRIYCSSGKHDAAALLLDKGLAIDPLNPMLYSLPGYLQLLDGKFDAAAESYRKMYQMDPESPIGMWFYAWSLIYAKRYGEAFIIIDQLNSDFPSIIFSSYGLFIKNALQGRKKEAMKIITPELEAVAKEAEYQAREIAHGYALLDEKELALDWLDNTIACGFLNYPFIAENDILLENVREEARFKELLEKVKYEWENFEE